MADRASTRLSASCEALIEATWLACLIVTPLLFNAHSAGVFEPDKAVVVRSLALVMASAGLVRWVDGRRARLQGPSSGGPRFSLRAGFWVIVALAYLGTHALSTVMSIAPHISFFGSFTRLQGLYTTAAYIVLFLGTLTFCRRRAQIERIIQACLVSSLPVSLYGILQRFGTDPIPWAGGDVSVRPASTLGNPIFLAAFLIMVVPLTIYRYVEVSRLVAEGQTRFTNGTLIAGGILNILFQLAAWSLGPVSGSLAALVTVTLWTAQGWLLSEPCRPFVRTGLYSVLLSAQLAAILLSGSRGPLLALLVGSTLCVALWAVSRGKRRWVAVTAAIFGGGIIILIMLNSPGSPLYRTELLPQMTVSRLARIAEGSGRVRLLLWEGVVGLMGEDPSRLAWGYGPESAQLVMSRHVPAELGRLAPGVPDRSHNETFDVLVESGLPGLSVYGALFTGLLVVGFRWAAVATTAAQRRSLVISCLSVASLSVLFARLLDGSWRLSGLAMPGGMLVGAAIFLFGRALLVRGSRRQWCTERVQATLVFCALLTHFVEIQVGIAVTSTRVYFWILLALMIGALATSRRGAGSPIVTTAIGDASTSLHPSTVPALMLSLTLLTLAYDFLPAIGTLATALPVTWLVGSSWLLSGALLASESDSEATRSEIVSHLVTYGALPLLAIFLVVAMDHLTSLLGNDPALSPIPFWVSALVVVMVTARKLSPYGRPRLLVRCPSPPAASVGRAVGANAGLAFLIVAGFAVLTSGVIVATNLAVVRADIAFKQAQLHFARPGEVHQAEGWAQRAVGIRPSRDHLHRLLGQIRTRQAEITAGEEPREAVFARAEDSLLTARQLNPLAAANSVTLGRLYRSWAEHVADEERRRDLFDQSSSAYGDALTRDPTNFRTWNELADLYAASDRFQQAEAAFEHSLGLNGTFVATHVGQGHLRLAERNPEDALRSFERANALDRESVEALRGMGIALIELGRVDDGIRAFERLIAIAPADLEVRLQLAGIYRSLGRSDLAAAHADAAVNLAPPERRAEIERRVRGLIARDRL